jgi:hypothetical protein
MTHPIFRAQQFYNVWRNGAHVQDGARRRKEVEIRLEVAVRVQRLFEEAVYLDL